MYNKTESSMESFALTWPGDVTDILLLNLYNVTDMVGVENYSDLEYEQFDISVGGSYQFNPAVYMTATVGYKIFEDNQPYVYGDQDGEMYTGYLGLGYKF